MLLFSSLEYSSSDITDSAGKTMQLGGGGGGACLILSSYEEGWGMKNVGSRKGWAKRELGKGREMDWRLGGGGGGGTIL